MPSSTFSIKSALIIFSLKLLFSWGQANRGNTYLPLSFANNDFLSSGLINYDKHVTSYRHLYDSVGYRYLSEQKHCPALENPDNNTILNGYCKAATSGQSCKFKCKNNFILDGKAEVFCKDIGNGTLEWDKAPRCKKPEEIVCPDIEKPDHGEIDGNCKKAKQGETCKFKCSKDYNLHGEEALHCEKDNTWSDEPPKCIKEQCKAPAIPDHGYVRCVIKKDENIGCEFSCEKGYTIDGEGNITCHEKQWSGPEPTCKEELKYCPALEKPDSNTNLNGYCETASSGETCTFTCEDDFIIDGKAELLCKDTGNGTLEWDQKVPLCIKHEEIVCPDLEEPDHGEIAGYCQQATPGETCKFKCSKDYNLHGEAVLHCGKDKTWSDEPPKCIKEQCKAPAIPDHGYVRCVIKKDENIECEFSCEKGYTIHGVENITCHGKKWSDPEPTCTKENSFCPDLEKPDNGEIDGFCKKATPGETCKFKCSEGYNLQGKPELHCQKDQKWSDEPPKCIKGQKYCPEIKEPDSNTNLNGSCKTATSGQSCTFTCKDNYIIDGKAELFCKDTGNGTLDWDDKVPRCKQSGTGHCPEIVKRDDNLESHGVCKSAGIGQSCTFTCKPNFILEGEEELFCMDTLEWNDVVPRCITSKQHCPPLDKPDDNMNWSGNCKTATKGQSCRFKCKENYIIDGKAILFCKESFKWSHEVPRCKKSDVRTTNATDCASIHRDNPASKSGVYKIYIKALNKEIEVSCDMETDGGGWTVFQRRNQNKPSENFWRNWEDYKHGFGENKSGEYWLGNENIHALSDSVSQVLRIDMEDFANVKKYAKYLHFTISNESSDYTLNVELYVGDAGEALIFNNNVRFSTKDHAIGMAGVINCANLFSKGAWWYKDPGYCHVSNLNGLNLKEKHATNGDGINWIPFHGYFYSLKSADMKMKPRVDTLK